MTDWSARVQEARVALMFLTRLPMGRIPEPVPDLDRVRWAFPLVGLPVGAIVWLAVFAASGLGASGLVSATLALVALALVTGALHFDGLADFADGLGGGRDRAHCLDIMRDSRIGSYGVLALILACGLWVGSVGAASVGLVSFLGISVASRLAMTAALIWMPAARPDGLGAMATGQGAVALLPGAGVTVFLMLWTGWAGLAALITMCLAALWIGRMALKRIGGQTGDVLGATQLVAETTGWVVLAMAAA